MPIKMGCRGTPDRIEWDRGAGMEHVLYSAVQGNPGTKRHQDGMQAAVQDRLDFRQKLSDLPLDDPDRTTDPDTLDKYDGRLFWGAVDGRKTALEPFADTYLVCRNVVIAIEGWDGTAYICSTSRVG